MDILYGIGLMSGTSLDGLDLCYVRFTKEKAWEFDILAATTLPYSASWKFALSNAIHLKATDLLELNVEYGFYLGEACQSFIIKNKIRNLDFIASHGHTVYHQPEKRFTLQIGDGRAINQLTGITTVYDFRMQDVLLGGNGAPLVPIGDELLFSNFDACLNLGGFSNISLRDTTHRRIAFDVCPVNIVLNYYCRKIDKEFDAMGEIAKNYPPDSKALSRLNNLEFYQKTGPKSLGLEWTEENIFPPLDRLSPEIAIATATVHAAQQISKIIKNLQLKNVLVTGGGAYNTFLISEIQKQGSGKLSLPNRQLIDFKEALIFALMGALKIRNEVNVLASATGASHDHSTGLVV